MATYKKDIIVAALAAASTDILRDNDNKIIVSTAAGIFYGNLMSEEGTSTGPSHVFVKAIEDVADKYHDECSSENNDGYFCLENAKLLNGGIWTNFPFVVLFFDQVIGISIGNI